MLSSQLTSQFPGIVPTTVVDYFSGLVGFRPDALWLGDSFDLVSFRELSAVSGALQHLPLTLMTAGPLARAAFGFPTTASSWEAGDASELDPGSASTLLTIVFRVTTPPIATRDLVGKRLAVPPFPGAEMSLSSSGDVLCNVSDGVSTVFANTAAAAADFRWHALVCSVDRSVGQVFVSSEESSSTPLAAPAGSLTNTALFSVGAGRTLGCLCEVALVAVGMGATVEGLSPAVIAENLAIELFWEQITDPMTGEPVTDPMTGDLIYDWIT